MSSELLSVGCIPIWRERCELKSSSERAMLPLTFALGGRPTASQRLLTLAAGWFRPADWHQAVVGLRDGRALEWPLYEVLRP